MSTGKVIIISAPSGSGKSTIINALMAQGNLNLQFSVSATNREPRGSEQNGIDYHFLTTEEFRHAISDNAFLEFEEVYPGRYYGTLKSEIKRIADAGGNVVLDIDVNGGIRVKNQLGDQALALFIEPPSIEELRRRLTARATDSPESIEQRVERAAYELEQGKKYDVRIINDVLAAAVKTTGDAISDFINS